MGWGDSPCVKKKKNESLRALTGRAPGGAVCWEAASSPCPSQEIHFSSWHIHFGTPTPTQQSLCRHPFLLDILQMLIQSLPFSLSCIAVTAILFLLQFWKGVREKWVFFMFQEDGNLCLSWQQLLCWGRGDGCTCPMHKALGEGMEQDVSAWTAAGSLERVTAGLGWRMQVTQQHPAGREGKTLKKKKKSLTKLQLFGWGSGWLHFYSKCLVTQSHITLSAHLGPRDAA